MMEEAFYRCDMIVHSAGNGNNPTIAASYRSGRAIFDERRGMYHYFSRNDVITDYVLAPDDFPLGLRNIETLWNAVVKNERRSDARYCREVQVALPKELSIRQSRDLIKKWARKFLVEGFGVPCHVSVHLKRHINEAHAHVVFPERKWINGKWSNKIRNLNRKTSLFNLRKSWADSANDALEKAESSARVDHRSNHERQVEALDIVNDASKSYEERVRAYATFLSLNYFVSGKVARTNEYRNNMNEHPDVHRSRSERALARARAKSLLDENLANAVDVDRHLAADKEHIGLLVRELKARQNKRRKRGRNSVNKILRVTKADLAAHNAALKMANATIREGDLTTQPAMSMNAPHLPDASEDKSHKPGADDTAQKRKLSPAEIRARQMRRRGGR